MYKENYELWKNNLSTEDLKNELLNLSDEQIKDAFYQNLEFGTGGLRGIMGVGTNRINTITIKKSTLGYANYIKKNFENPSVAISYDNRINSKTYAYTAARVLAAEGIKVYIVSELRPTPYLSFLIREFNTSGGIMITASHNPKEYNGYKVYEPHGGQLNLENSEAVINEINLVDDIFNIKELDNDLIIEVDLEKYDELYLSKVKEISLTNFNDKATILYSPLHGTGGTLIPKLLNSLEYNYYSFEPHLIPDGNFTNTKSANPEDKIAYDDLLPYAKEIDADILILTDPDADRIGAAVKHNNDYHIINGNQIAVIHLYYILENTKNINNGYVFMSNVTTDLIRVIAEDYGVTVEETLPGFKFIAEKIEAMNDNETYVFGCEESNGNIVNEFVRDKDAVQSALMLSEIQTYLKNNNMSVLDYLESIYQKYGYFLEETVSYSFEGISGKETINNLMNYFRENKVSFEDNELVLFEDLVAGKNYDLINNVVTDNPLPSSNVLKFAFRDNSWIMARPSGTEPKIKIYYSVIDSDYNVAKSKLNNYKNSIDNIINKIK